MKRFFKAIKNLTAATVENFHLKNTSIYLRFSISFHSIYINECMRLYKQNILETPTLVAVARLARKECEHKLKHLPRHIKNTALFEVVLHSISELIKNALDAGANTIYFGFIYIGTNIACIVKDDGTNHIERRFPELRSGAPLKYRQILNGESKIKSDKSLSDLGKQGRGLAGINELLEKCGGFLLVAKSSKGGAKIKLVAPIKAHIPNFAEIRLAYGSYFGDGDADTVLHHEQVTRRMSIEPPRPFLSPTSVSSSSVVSPVPVAEEKKREDLPKSPSSLPKQRPAPALIRDCILRDDEERVRVIHVYSPDLDHNQTIKISTIGKIKHRIFYDSSGTPLKCIKYDRDGEIKGHLQLNLESTPEVLALPYADIQSITFFKRAKTSQELVVAERDYFHDDPKTP